MSIVFSDTSFYVALASTRDTFHSKARSFTEAFRGKVITTDFIVVEVGNYFSRSQDRHSFEFLLNVLRADRNTTIVPATRDLLNRGIELYTERSDKDWSLTGVRKGSGTFFRRRRSLAGQHGLTEKGS